MRSDVMEEFHRKLLAEGDLQGALQVLRDGGYSKVQSIKALMDTGRYGLEEVKALVHESTAWDDVRQRDSDFHESLEAEIDELEPPS